jgi:superfamily II DNA or RNA helicase
MDDYQTFIARKSITHTPVGMTDDPTFIAPLFDYQRKIVSWALAKGRAAIFADCGLGKTVMQLEWARNVGGRALIITPLAVAEQTAAEAARFGIAAKVCRDGVWPDDGVLAIVNYQSLHKLDCSQVNAVVLDESSILKSVDGKTRTQIIETFANTPYRLACTATPAPNDHMELGNHAEFLGAMTQVEMLATFFTHDGGDTSKWRIKGHARADFWRWCATWAVMAKRPSDLGYSDEGFELPPMEIHRHIVDSDYETEGQLFGVASSLGEQRGARRASLANRVAKVAELANGNDEQWIVWCDLNDEGDELTKAINGAVQVAGANSDDEKSERMMAFSRGEIRVLVTKPKIAGFGMNWQQCHNMAFVGLTHSYEAMYQAMRRVWRFGQENPVNVHITVSLPEMPILDNINRKEKEAEVMATEMVKHMCSMSDWGGLAAGRDAYHTEDRSGEKWLAMRGDCVERVKDIKSDSVGFTVFSPPFASLYTYSASARDMGNCASHSEFYEHFRFLVDELLRVTMPGRLCAFHCMNLPTSKTRDGVIGITDFRGELIRMFTAAGWIYHSEVTIWKDPVVAMQRTKALGLLHKQLKKDSCMSRQGIPDYLVVMRKPGDNPERVEHTNESFPVGVWQQYASPVWMDINPSDTLQHRSVREDEDERHICPLQLPVIRRALKMWSNPGDVVLSPFMGIGSEGVVALEEGRRFVGVELKESYFGQSCANLAIAETPPQMALL